MKYTILDFFEDYPDDDICLDELFQDTHGNMLFCPRCAVVKPKYYRVNGRPCYACQDCGHHIYPLAGTIFHRTRTSLRLWFYAIYLFANSKNGVSAKELERQLGVTYKTAWRMARQIRLLMRQEAILLKGHVETDEAYIGGRRRSSNWWKHKTPLLGAVERGGEVRVKVVDYATVARVSDFLGGSVLAGSILHTDESNLYIWTRSVYTRQSVKHGRRQYVDGDNYTNTIEGFWGLLKPALTGTHRSVSKKYLQLYVDERAWHYNHRRLLAWPALRSEAAKRLR